MVAVKSILAALNVKLQDDYAVSITHSMIIRHVKRDDVGDDLKRFIGELDKFRR